MIKLYKCFIFILCFVLCCSEADEMIHGIPRIATSRNVFTGASGAVFEAIVLSNGKDDIIDHGFQWREFGKFEIDFVSGGLLESNNFLIEVNQGFVESKQYEVRAYLTTSFQKAFGEWVKFSGAGSKAPIVTAINPLQGTWGDTVVVSGKYFSNNPGVVKVEFGDVAGELISSTDSLLIVKVPSGFVKTVTTSIKIKVGPKFANSSQTFSLLGTQVLQVTPNKGGSGTVVVIKGKYFNPTYSSVKFGDVVVPIAQAYKDSLKLILPKEVPGGDKDVTVFSGPFEATLSKAFSRNYPKLLEVISRDGFYGDTVVLRGENFGAKFTDNHVSVNETFANIIGVKEKELKIIVPTIPLPELKFTITADYVANQSDITFRVNKPSINDLLPDTPIYPGQLITIKGKNFYPSIYNYPYSFKVNISNKEALVTSASRTELKAEFPLLSSNTSPIDVIRFDTSIVSSVEQVVTPIKWTYTFPGEQRAKSASFTIGAKTYILTGIQFSTVVGNEVYEFDAGNKSWNTLSSFPGEPRYGATAFVINNKGYVMGGYGSSNTPLNDLWEYTPSTDTWLKKKDYLFHPLEAFNLNGTIYSISNITYIIVPPSTEVTGFGYNTEFWKYNPSADSWTKSAAPSYILNRNSSQDYFTMQIGTNLIIGHFNFSTGAYFYQQYNATSNTWVDKGFVNINGTSPIAFDYGGNGYLLVNKSLHKYNPTLNQWSQLEEDLGSLLWQGGEPIKFKINDSWYFSLFNYNQYSFGSQISYKNMVLEFNCSIAGF